MAPISLALDSLLKRYSSNYKLLNGRLPSVAFDPPMPSLCTDMPANDAGDIVLFWQPVERTTNLSFSDLESSFEFQFPKELQAFYGAFWSDTIPVEHRSGLRFNLIQLWNDEDEKRLKENLLGHIFAKMKNRMALNYFIGSTDGNDVICLDHETLRIVVEKPGYVPHQTFDVSLEQFILDLSPVVN